MPIERVAPRSTTFAERAWTATKDLAGLKPVRFSGYALFGAVIVGLPFLLGSNYLTRVAVTCGIYIMLSLGLNIVVGFCGLLDLGYVAFYAIGAYTYAFLASPQFGIHWPWLVILPLCALVPAFFGVLLGTPTLRLRGDYLAIVTLGFGEIVRMFLNNMDGVTNGPKGIANIDTVSIFGFEFGTPGRYYYLVLVFVLLFVFAISRLGHSRVGRAWGAIREDEVAAKAMGLNTHSLKLRAFAMGASFAGVAGLMFAGFQSFVSPESFTFGESVIIFCMITLGGMGSIPGAILGSVVLVVLPELLRPVADYRYLLYGLLLILVMTMRPQGLWPSKQRQARTDREERAMSARSLISQGEPLLRVDGLTMALVGYWRCRISLRGFPGEIVAMIGPNGAGKTTVFNVLTAMYRATSGAMTFDGHDLVGFSPHRGATVGLGPHLPEHPAVPDMSALDNVKVGRYCRTRAGVLGALTRLPWTSGKSVRSRLGRSRHGFPRHPGPCGRTGQVSSLRRSEAARDCAGTGHGTSHAPSG